MADAPKFVFDVNASDLGPSKDTTRREETGQSVDVGDPVVTRIAGGGGFTVYARPTLLGYLLWGVLGAKTVAGAAAPFTHTQTPADDKPYFTIWRTLFGGAVRITEVFEDCKLTQAVLSGEPGGDVMCQVGAVALNFRKLPNGAPMPSGGAYVDDLPLRVPNRVFNKNGQAADNVANFSLTINSAVNTAQTSKITDSYAEQGRREMTLSFEEVFTDPATYERAYYNADGSPRTGVHYEPIGMRFLDEAGAERLTVDAPRFGYNTAPLTPNPNGEIARQGVEGWVARNPGGAALTTSVKNAVASYS